MWQILSATMQKRWVENESESQTHFFSYSKGSLFLFGAISALGGFILLNPIFNQNGLASEHYFSLGGNLSAHFTSTSSFEFSDEKLLLLKAHLPGLNLLTQPSSLSQPRNFSSFKNLRPDDSVHAPDIEIEHIESEQFELLQKGSHVRLWDRWNGKLSPDFVHLLYGAARLAWINHKILPIHAACVGNKSQDGYVLLVGHPGVGKTSITLQSATQNGLRVFSGDKTLITVEQNGMMKAIDGTSVMTLRQEDLGRWPNLSSILDQSIESHDRLTFTLKRNTYMQSGGVPIRAIALVQLNDGVEKLQKLSPLSALHTLYPYFMDVERADVLIAGGKGIFIGTPHDAVKKELTPLLANSLEKIPTYLIVGSLNHVTKQVELLSK